MNNDQNREIKNEILRMFDRGSDDVHEIAAKLDEVYNGQQEEPRADFVEYAEKQLKSYKNQESDAGLLIKNEMAIYLADRLTDIYEKANDPELLLSRVSEVFGEENAREVVDITNKYVVFAREGFEAREPAL